MHPRCRQLRLQCRRRCSKYHLRRRRRERPSCRRSQVQLWRLCKCPVAHLRRRHSNPRYLCRRSQVQLWRLCKCPVVHLRRRHSRSHKHRKSARCTSARGYFARVLRQIRSRDPAAQKFWVKTTFVSRQARWAKPWQFTARRLISMLVSGAVMDVDELVYGMYVFHIWC